jgi:hypothetical protein
MLDLQTIHEDDEDEEEANSMNSEEWKSIFYFRVVGRCKTRLTPLDDADYA